MTASLVDPSPPPSEEMTSSLDSYQTPVTIALERPILVERWRGLELWLVGALSLLMMIWGVQANGVWEPWESLTAQVLDWMIAHETWLHIHVPTGPEQARYVPELAFGWWPTLATYQLWPDELGLRLPTIILTSLCTVSLFAVARSSFGRATAWLSSLLFLALPVVNLGGRFALNGNLGWLWVTLSCLCLFGLHRGPKAEIGLPKPMYLLRIGAWSGWLMGGLSVGVIGLAFPLILLAVFLYDGAPDRRTLALRIHIIPFLISASLLGVCGWRLYMKSPEDLDWAALLIWIDPLLEPFDASEHRGFQAVIHQIGYGLLPIGALIPVAFSFILSDRDDDPSISREGSVLAWWFSLGFILPAIGVAFSGASLPLMAPAVALCVGVYLARAPSLPPQPLWVLISVLFLFLIDSDLKREPQMLISTLAGTDVTGFPDKFSAWPLVRTLTLMTLGALMLFHTHMIQLTFIRIRDALRRPLRPHLHPLFILSAAVLCLACILPQVLYFIPKWVVADAFVKASFWGRVVIWVRHIALALIGLLGGAVFLWTLWAHHERGVSRPQRSWREGGWIDVSLGLFISTLVMTPHYLSGLPRWRLLSAWIDQMSSILGGGVFGISMTHLIAWTLVGVGCKLFFFVRRPARGALDRFFTMLTPVTHWALSPKVSLFTFGGCFLGWGLLSAAPLASAFTQQFSQRGIIERYEALAGPDEPLALYSVTDAHRSFYLKTRPQWTRTQFAREVKKEQRSFVVINRDQLSKVNKEFRRATKRNLPVLDDRGYRLLLVSTQLKEGEEDHNPINSALIKELPKTATALKTPIDFDQNIELVGWALNPRSPRPGAPLKISLFWRSKKRVTGAWKVFIHIDASGQRIHADHDPVEGLFPIKDWQPGDLIQDVHHLKVKSTIKPATFQFYTGLFQGSRRMKVLNKDKKLHDGKDRARIGKVVVR